MLAAHCVHLDDADLELWRQHDVAVAHCPASNAKLASGIAPLRAMLDRGIRVGMGTDGPASNDGLDLFADLRLAAQLARLAGRSADGADRGRGVLAGHRRGRRRRSAGRTSGSSRSGRRADLVHVDTRDLVFEPVGDPADLLAHLVWSGAGRHVRDVWVGGRQVVRGRRLHHGGHRRAAGRRRPAGRPPRGRLSAALRELSSTERLTTPAARVQPLLQPKG